MLFSKKSCIPEKFLCRNLVKDCFQFTTKNEKKNKNKNKKKARKQKLTKTSKSNNDKKMKPRSKSNFHLDLHIWICSKLIMYNEACNFIRPEIQTQVFSR